MVKLIGYAFLALLIIVGFWRILFAGKKINWSSIPKGSKRIGGIALLCILGFVAWQTFKNYNDNQTTVFAEQIIKQHFTHIANREFEAAERLLALEFSNPNYGVLPNDLTDWSKGLLDIEDIEGIELLSIKIAEGFQGLDFGYNAQDIKVFNIQYHIKNSKIYHEEKRECDSEGILCQKRAYIILDKSREGRLIYNTDFLRLCECKGRNSYQETVNRQATERIKKQAEIQRLNERKKADELERKVKSKIVIACKTKWEGVFKIRHGKNTKLYSSDFNMKPEYAQELECNCMAKNIYPRLFPTQKETIIKGRSYFNWEDYGWDELIEELNINKNAFNCKTSYSVGEIISSLDPLVKTKVIVAKPLKRK